MEKTKVLSFHNDIKIKQKYLSRLEAHRQADEIIKGKYWEEGKGCAVGCTVHSSSHDVYPVELGICWQLALVEDGLFENLPNEDAKNFPIEFLEAIPVGINTDVVYRKWVLWVLADEKEGLINVIKNEEHKKALQSVADLYTLSFEREIKHSEWKKLADKYAYAYSYSYAYTSTYTYTSASDYYSAYASASASASAYAYASAYASEYAYASASDYASDYASEWQEIKNKRIVLMKDKLIDLLKEGK